MEVLPRYGSVKMNPTDEAYIITLLTSVAKEYGLKSEKLPPAEFPNTESIVAYRGEKLEGFPRGIAWIRLWRASNSGLEIDIGAPGGASWLSDRIFNEVKTKLVEHFGTDRARAVRFTVVNPI